MENSRNSFRRHRPLILVIDDEQKVLDEVAAVLSSAGLAHRCCSRPDEAVAAAQETPPDLILCDIGLSGESGPETCQRIKTQPGLEDIPVMFLSPSQGPDIIRRSHASAGVYCLRKPFDPTVLVELIDQALRAPVPVLVDNATSQIVGDMTPAFDSAVSAATIPV